MSLQFHLTIVLVLLGLATGVLVSALKRLLDIQKITGHTLPIGRLGFCLVCLIGCAFTVVLT